MPEIHAVTGAFGFTGRFIAERLLMAGVEVRTLTNTRPRVDPFGGRVRVYPLAFDRTKFGGFSNWSWNMKKNFWRRGMPTLVIEEQARAQAVEVTEEELQVALTDGRTIVVPLVWFPRLWHGSEEERQNWVLIGEGEGITGRSWTKTSR